MGEPKMRGFVFTIDALMALLIADCGAKGIAKGGVFGDRPVITTALANNGNVICNVRVWVSQR
ncbi:MAG: hypothetical protein ACP5H8_01645 [Candidatus Micrarchaeia archaeon]